MNLDKLNFFIALGYASKFYNFAIRMQFLRIKHPSFENRWNTVFKWEDRVRNNKGRSDFDR